MTTRDVAQGGIKIDTPVPLKVGEQVTITLEGFRPLDSEVRWVEGFVAGIAFGREIGWQELMPWLKERRKTALAAAAESTVSGPSGPVILPSLPIHAAPPVQSRDPFPQTVQLNLAARVREGTRRWKIEVSSITTRTVEFESYVALGVGTLLWIVLPGLEGWPARIVDIDGYRFTCEFTQPLHPAVLERILSAKSS